MDFLLDVIQQNKLLFEGKDVFNLLIKAHRSLGEMKGVANSLPRREILINTLSLQEAKESSEIENIITTQDALFKSDMIQKKFISGEAKEVHMYAEAVKVGFDLVDKNELILNNYIEKIQGIIEGNNAGFRKQGGVEIVNEKTKEVIYTPPQDYSTVLSLMNDLEAFINTPNLCELDSLIKMAIIHYQFEAIHPFSDGNGRTGRIINILYLVREGLLDLPILYMSRYINRTKDEYYMLLQKVDSEGARDAWVMYMLQGIHETSMNTTEIIYKIKNTIYSHKQYIKEHAPKVYSHDLLNNIFSHPYTKISFLSKELSCSRITAAKYLDRLVDIGILEKIKVGRENFYINKNLFTILSTS